MGNLDAGIAINQAKIIRQKGVDTPIYFRSRQRNQKVLKEVLNPFKQILIKL